MVGFNDQKVGGLFQPGNGLMTIDDLRLTIYE